jgi:hypothetical protein
MTLICPVLSMGDVLLLKLYFLGLEVSTLEEGLTVNVPLFYTLNLLVVAHEQPIGRQQVRQDHSAPLSQQTVILHLPSPSISVPQFRIPLDTSTNLPSLHLGDLTEGSDDLSEFLLAFRRVIRWVHGNNTDQ